MMFFELRAGPGGRSTHAAALEFTAAEGTVGVPPLLAARLGTTPLHPAGGEHHLAPSPALPEYMQCPESRVAADGGLSKAPGACGACGAAERTIAVVIRRASCLG
jgi:hypothetical protein